MYKRYIISFILSIILSINLFGAWDQSLRRWSSDCDYGMASACAIVAKMYEDGEIVTFDGVNHEKKVKKQPKKALKFYKKACSLGDNIACKDYNKLASKLGLKSNSIKKDNKNYSIKSYNTKKIYTIKGKKPCKLIFKNKQLIQNSCKRLKNSKGVLIYCTKDMKVCKTKTEILNSL